MHIIMKKRYNIILNNKLHIQILTNSCYYFVNLVVTCGGGGSKVKASGKINKKLRKNLDFYAKPVL